MNRTLLLLALAAGAALFALIRRGPPAAPSSVPAAPSSPPAAPSSPPVVSPPRAPAAPTSARAPEDGIYFLGGDRVLLLTDGRFTLLQAGAFPSRLEGRAAGGNGGLLSLFGVKTQTYCSFALVDGRLHLGVMNRTADAHDSWFSNPCDLAFLPDGTADRWPWNDASTRISYDAKRSVWTFSSGAVKEFAAPAVLLRSPDDAHRFVPVFIEESSMMSSPFTALVQSDRWHWGDRNGVSWSGGLVTPASGLAALQADADRRRELFGSTHRVSGFRETEATILTPWSVDLGPAGFLPLADPPDPAGVWISESHPGQSVTVTLGCSPLRPQLTLGPSAQNLDEMLEKHGFCPDALGISHETFAFNCMMNHYDSPTEVFWMQLSADRALRYVSRGGHYIRSAVGPEVFHRK